MSEIPMRVAKPDLFVDAQINTAGLRFVKSPKKLTKTAFTWAIFCP
jgi:hypothetical protein